MSHLAKLLEDVLAGRRVVSDASTFRLLRRFAPHKSSRLDELEEQARRSRSADDTATAPLAASRSGAPSIHLTRSDLTGILEHRRSSTIDELEWLLAHGNDREVRLTTTEELELRNLLARQILDRFLRARGVNRNEEFIAVTLGTYRTAWGDLTKAEIELLESIRAHAYSAIFACADHRREHCACWRDAREQLFGIRSRAGEDSALANAALAVWNSIESLARNRQRQVAADQSEGPPGFTYNWRYYSNPEYFHNTIHR
jgi:hypothetical protein